jgi:hypothetical protein
VILDDVRESSLRRIVATAPSGGAPVAWLSATRDCVIEGVRSPNAETLARLSGSETARVRVVAGEAGSAQQVVLLDDDVDTTALRTNGGVIAKSSKDGPRAVGAEPSPLVRPAD